MEKVRSGYPKHPRNSVLISPSYDINGFINDSNLPFNSSMPSRRDSSRGLVVVGIYRRPLRAD